MTDLKPIDPQKGMDADSDPEKNSRRLVKLAVVISAVAVVLAVALPQIMPQKFRSPIATHADFSYFPSGEVIAPAPECTHMTNAEVTISVPESGIVSVSAFGRAALNHSLGFGDVMSLFISSSSSECTFPYAWIEEIPGTWPSERFLDVSYSLQTTFAVSGAGTYTLYLNGQMWQGGDSADNILTASLLAVYYPG